MKRPVREKESVEEPRHRISLSPVLRLWLRTALNFQSSCKEQGNENG